MPLEAAVELEVAPDVALVVALDEVAGVVADVELEEPELQAASVTTTGRASASSVARLSLILCILSIQ